MKRCACGSPVNIRAQHDQCRRCRVRTVSASYRRKGEITLAEQLLAWRLWRAGTSVNHIAYTIRRLPTDTRAIVFGAA